MLTGIFHAIGISTAGTTGPKRPPLDDAEAALVEQYPRLVRLAYLILTPELGRHRRLLVAHSLVQKSLSGAGRTRSGPTVPAPRGESGEAFLWLRGHVVSAALRAPGRSRRFPAWPTLPAVLGLRLFPKAGGDDEPALDRALAGVTPAVRAAFVLLLLEGLAPQATAYLLAGAGVADPDKALVSADRLRASFGREAESLLQGVEFDPCTVQARPTDLLRRRRRTRLTGLTVALALLATAGAVVVKGSSQWDDRPPAVAVPTPASAEAFVRASEARHLVRVPGERWADTARVDFSAWPARGARTGDTALLTRTLRTWFREAGVGGTRAASGSQVAVAVTPGTPRTPPLTPAQLLFADTVENSAVVLLHDGHRIIRYTEPLAGGGPAALELARTDDADVTTGTAVVVSSTDEMVRFLVAPWIEEIGVRDLLRRDATAAPLGVSDFGVTDPVSRMPTGCGSAPVLELRSSTRIVEDHSFLLTELGELTPVHLTWTPPPGAGAPARQPREATSPAGLAAWRRSVCSLPALRGTGVRAVNRWEFAQQSLPEQRGRATWTCLRAENWEGRGRVAVAMEEPSGARHAVPGPSPVPADTAACSRFGQHVLAGTYWVAPSGARHYLAAGSRRLTSVTAGGAVSATARGPLLAVRATTNGPVTLTGTVPGSGELRGWGGTGSGDGGRLRR
ncbi:hypothetical protein [Streptomyces sp. NPDC026092]|uniref:hypothetical protein n=1 Tax=Streptomyces sp. NPDC026092 TaxID=3154797 RepID=UPI0033D00B45